MIGHRPRRDADGLARDAGEPQQVPEGGGVAATGERLDRGLGQGGQLVGGRAVRSLASLAMVLAVYAAARRHIQAGGAEEPELGSAKAEAPALHLSESGTSRAHELPEARPAGTFGPYPVPEQAP